MLAPYALKQAIALPLKQTGKVEAVLLVASTSEQPSFTETDVEILSRFAEQATLAWHTARLMSREERMFSQLATLHQISDHIQRTREMQKILHVVLTGVTAGYGLGFNRAAFFELDARQATLVGAMGIGQLTEATARLDWATHHQRKLDQFDNYLAALETEQLELTPVGRAVQELRFPIQKAEDDLFSRVVAERQWYVIHEAEEYRLKSLPLPFQLAFLPDTPLCIVPVIARDQVLGVLVVDNKFTKNPISREGVESLMTFASTLSISLENAQLFRTSEEARDLFQSFFAASNALVTPHDPETVLSEIVERARTAAYADGVSMILIDEIGQVGRLITAGSDGPSNQRELIRQDGLSMQVMRSKQIEVIENCQEHKERINPSVFWRGVQAALCLPLVLEGKSIGVVWFHYRETRSFKQWETDAAQLYVNQAAIAYASARRIKELGIFGRRRRYWPGQRGARRYWSRSSAVPGRYCRLNRR